MNFPTDLPNGCPPHNASNCNGRFFHLLQVAPPGSDDLKSFHEKGRTLSRPPSCECMPYGLSVFTDRDDAMQMCKLMPRLGKFIGTLLLSQTDGKVMLTPGQKPTHHTWWPSIECDRSKKIEKTEAAA